MSDGQNSLSALPAEIYALVLEYIQEFPRASHDFFSVKDESTKALLSLCLMCRAIRHFFQPALYKSVTVSTNFSEEIPSRCEYNEETTNPWKDEKEIEAQLPERFAQLIRTIVARPDLAKEITRIQVKLGFHRFVAKPGEIVHDPISPNQQERDELNLLSQLHWLLSQLTNLEELDFRNDSIYRSLWAKICSRGSTNGPNHDFLPKLQKFRAAPHYSNLVPLYSTEIGCFVSPTPGNDLGKAWHFARKTVFDLADYQLLFEKPGLQHLSLTFAAAMGDLPHRFPLRLSNVNLTSLELWRCYIPHGVLKSILQVCHGLKVLRIDSDLDETEVLTTLRQSVDCNDQGVVLSTIWEEHFTIDIYEMQEALDCCETTLEELSLKFYSGEDLDNPETLSFRHFSNLKKLLVMSEKVVLTEGLPPTLEQLICCRFDMKIDWYTALPKLEYIRGVAQVPKLKRLCLIGGEANLDHVMYATDEEPVRISHDHPMPGGRWEERKVVYSIVYVFDDLEIELIDDGQLSLDSSLDGESTEDDAVSSDAGSSSSDSLDAMWQRERLGSDGGIDETGNRALSD